MPAPGLTFDPPLPARERTLLGQFYTPPLVAELLAALTITPAHRTILDPACGAGELLLAARALRPDATLAGIDIHPAAAAAARDQLRGHATITTGDFFAAPSTPTWDCILANPPYVRSQQQDDRDPAARARLFAAAASAGVDADAKTDLYAFFLYRSLCLLKPDGRLGFITPAACLTSHYAAAFHRILTDRLNLVALVASTAESFIPDADIHTVLIIADNSAPTAAPIKLVTLRNPLSTYPSLPRLAADILAPRARSHETCDLRIHLTPATTPPSRWSLLLRAPLSAAALFASPAFTPIHTLARVALGYKSLQNDFYYLDAATIAAHAIEPRYLQSIHMLGDLDAAAYHQQSAAPRHIFLCRDPDPAPGARRYIAAMADRPAARRKQSAAPQTIRAALTAQGGALWYAPKARPHAAHLWLRKAVDGVHAPFIFPAAPAVVDQRCNSLTPTADLPWPLLAAVTTTTLFACSVELHGAASLGAGALEATTTHLRDYPIFDPRPLPPGARAELLTLACAVWSHEAPIDWRRPDAAPGPHLRALDAWLLARTGADVSPDRLYTDLRATCHARIAVARPR